MLLLFVDNDHTQIRRGCEHSTAGANDDPGVSGTDTFPLIIALACRQAAVLYGNKVAEMGSQQAQ